MSALCHNTPTQLTDIPYNNYNLLQNPVIALTMILTKGVPHSPNLFISETTRGQEFWSQLKELRVIRRKRSHPQEKNYCTMRSSAHWNKSKFRRKLSTNEYTWNRWKHLFIVISNGCNNYVVTGNALAYDTRVEILTTFVLHDTIGLWELLAAMVRSIYYNII